MLANNTEVVPAATDDTVDAPAEPATTTIPSVEDTEVTEAPATSSVIVYPRSRRIKRPSHYGEFDTEDTVRDSGDRLALVLVVSTLTSLASLFGGAVLLNYNGSGRWNEPINPAIVRDVVTTVLPAVYTIILVRARQWKWASAAFAAFIGLIAWYCFV